MNNKKIIEILIKLAIKSAANDEVPVACLIVDKNGKIITKSINNRIKKYTVLGHAEISAIEKTEKKIKDWRLNGYSMVVSLKPCEMCQKIIEETRIDHVFYLLDREKTQNIIHNMTKINDNEFEQKYYEILRTFFADKR